PALRPRWCPGHLPSRVQDGCLPATENRRLSPQYILEGYPLSTTLPIGGPHHAACWRGFGQVGLEPSPVLTYWVTATNFMRFALHSKVSGFPWRDQCLVRCGMGTEYCLWP